MAQDMLDKEKGLEQTVFLAQVDAMKTTDSYGIPRYISENKPTSYTTEQLLTRSQALYSFINDRSNNKEIK
jgi:hypothetical protein